MFTDFKKAFVFMEKVAKLCQKTKHTPYWEDSVHFVYVSIQEIKDGKVLDTLKQQEKVDKIFNSM